MWLDCNYFNKNRLSDALLMQRVSDDIVIVLQNSFISTVGLTDTTPLQNLHFCTKTVYIYVTSEFIITCVTKVYVVVPPCELDPYCTWWHAVTETSKTADAALHLPAGSHYPHTSLPCGRGHWHGLFWPITHLLSICLHLAAISQRPNSM